MFAKLKEGIGESGEQLHQQVGNALAQIQTNDEGISFSIVNQVFQAYLEVRKNYGPLENMSTASKKAIANHLMMLAKRNAEVDLARAYGYFFYSAYVESQALSGQEAEKVKEITGSLLKKGMDFQSDRKSQSI